ncbi:hypothetical protein CEXT_575891 [Caerostris extrusa]|uniref:Uncharacterized protein n=1 Tax=Caerostris extrusa TaxID=172846 RepID=A0AAV4RBK3_CAEEX|nr:hypothetical protein CEXT_575891 [Caerostris extrusa]
MGPAVKTQLGSNLWGIRFYPKKSVPVVCAKAFRAEILNQLTSDIFKLRVPFRRMKFAHYKEVIRHYPWWSPETCNMQHYIFMMVKNKGVVFQEEFSDNFALEKTWKKSSGCPTIEMLL